jgi:hypothetical protein
VTTRKFALWIALGLALGAACGPAPKIYIDSPTHGTFLNGASVTVQGRLDVPAQFQSLTVNGIAVTPAATWSVNLPVSAAAVFNRIAVTGVLTSGGILRENLTVVVGNGVQTGFVQDGVASPESVALRIAATGLVLITPIVVSLSGDSLDISSLITAQNPIAQGSMSGINHTANVVAVGFGGLGSASIRRRAGSTPRSRSTTSSSRSISTSAGSAPARSRWRRPVRRSTAPTTSSRSPRTRRSWT